MKQLVIATGNEGKAKEFRAMLEPLGFTLRLFGGEVEETGAAYEENARIKARFAMEETGLPALADDSGLEVDALDGAPGIYSARFAEPGQRKALLLQKLQDETNRKARFVSCIVLLYPDGREITATGFCEGEINENPRGTGGFGYDPVFYLPEYGKTMAEIPDELKNRISHRARALQNLIEQIGKNYDK